MRVSPRNIDNMFIIAFRGFGNSRGEKLYGKLYVSLVWFVWQEINVRIFESKRDLKGRCGTSFTFTLLCGLLVPLLLEAFLFQFYF